MMASGNNNFPESCDDLRCPIRTEKASQHRRNSAECARPNSESVS